MKFRIRSDIGYLTVLAIASGVILVFGFALRPRNAPAPTISEAERVQLQNLAQRQALQRRAVMLSGYARDLSGRAAQILQQPASFSSREPRPGEMLIVVSVTGSGDPRWITTEFAGYEPVTCGGETLSRLSVDALVPRSLHRAAVFTLDEDYVGLVADCDDQLIIVSPRDHGVFPRIAAEQKLMACCGVRFSTEATGQPGRIVKELRIGSILDLAGVEAGDRLLKINGEQVTSEDALQRALASPELLIDVERSGRTITLKYRTALPATGATLQRSPEGAQVVRVLPGSAAERFGLNIGDVVVRAGDVRRPAPAVVEKVLAGTNGVRIVVLRKNRELLLESER